MSFTSSLSTIGLLLVAMAILSLVEAVVPLRARGAWSNRHLVPNLVLTFITFGANLIFNIPLLLGLVWLQSVGFGLFNAFAVHPLIEFIATVLALDLVLYVAHVSMHRIPGLWRLHSVHHSDPAVDVTTTVRQHPGESVVRFVYLATFASVAGASPASLAIYRVWSALHAQFEHANVKLPQWLDTTITLVFTSPNMHKIHHSRDQRLTDRNYANIFSFWDRMLGTFTPSRYGTDIVYGLDGYDGMDQQTIVGLLSLPFDKVQNPVDPQPSVLPSSSS